MLDPDPATLTAAILEAGKQPPPAPIDSTGRPWSDADIDRYALVIAAAGGDDQWINGTKSDPDFDPQILMNDYRSDARAVLGALHDDERLCPTGTLDRLAEVEAAVQRVRDLCARALTDDGVGSATGWATAVLDALDGSCERDRR
ncbi:hypothetical protein [Micromonospora echinospora]|uniref:hypothetical protein n=1 Tax=Micromonospora echinospora TaxID=1877 RepID=UPI003A838CB2